MRRRMRTVRRYRRRRRGGSFRSRLSQLHDWVRRNQLISRGANVLGQIGFYPGIVNPIGALAKQFGYGRRRRVGRPRLRRTYRRRRLY